MCQLRALQEGYRRAETFEFYKFSSGGDGGDLVDKLLLTKGGRKMKKLL